MTKLVILDRDGVINHDSPNYIRSVDEFIPLFGSIEAIADLSKNGFTVAIATNQSGVGRGFYTLETLEQMHIKLRNLVEDEGGQLGLIKYCPHLPSDKCKCRKPQPKMLLDIMKYYGAKAKDVYFVGDSYTDMQAAEKAKCREILVTTGRGEDTISYYFSKKEIHPTLFANLRSFANCLIRDGEIYP